MPRRLSLQGSARREAFTPGSMIGNNEVVRTASARDVWCMRCHAMPCQPFPNSCSGGRYVRYHGLLPNDWLERMAGKASSHPCKATIGAVRVCARLGSYIRYCTHIRRHDTRGACVSSSNEYASSRELFNADRNPSQRNTR